MAKNPYASKPLCVAQVEPTTGAVIRAHFFLGNVPRSVLEAARRGPGWAKRDGEVLRQHYGPGWRDLLTAKPPPAPGLAAYSAYRARTIARFGEAVTGGALDFGDLGAVDDIAAAAADDTPDSLLEAQQSHEPDASHVPRPAVYSDVAVYAEDSIYDLRLKLAAVSGAPPYRAHLFYYVNEEGPLLPYAVTVDGAPLAVDWRALGRLGATGATLAGLAVDERLLERREGIKVAAFDTFTALAPTPGVRVTRAYYVDLFAAVSRDGAGFAALLRDRYQFDLLYYGALLKYFPLLSPDACLRALSDPASLPEAYPALDPDLRAVRARLDLERAIADASLRWRPAAATGVRAPVAVTSATIGVTPAARMRVAIRNVFDAVPTSPQVAAVSARFEYDGVAMLDATAATSDATRRGVAQVLAQKRHASSYGPKVAAAVDWFLDHANRRDAVSFAIAREIASDEQAMGGARLVPFAFLTLYSDGRYEATADWREDDRMGFGDVAASVARLAAPTVERVNGLGAVAFPKGGAVGDGRNHQIGAITVSAFWPHAVSAAAFQDIKGRFRQFEKAGVVGIRGLQQAGVFVFSFRRGVVAYDPRLVERIEADVANQYAWLTDPGVAARWAAVFSGRTVRVFHRATDLRVEIVGADSLAEFEMIRRYLFSFLDGLLTGPARLLSALAPPPREPRSSTTAASRRLLRLKERDPALFDLKKHDPAAKQYSVLCQSKHQPHVYSPGEAKLLGERRRAALVKYWNFTEQTDAYYECPDAAFPHLVLRQGAHPLGYCLPCCGKTRPAEGSRTALTTQKCLSRGADSTDIDAEPSRHVLSYGKAIPAGRLAELPAELAQGLFLSAVVPAEAAPKDAHAKDSPVKDAAAKQTNHRISEHRLLLVGVEQSTPAVPDAGYAYALAYGIGLGEETTDRVLTELAAGVTSDTYHALGDGAGAAFGSAGELATAIIDAFVRRADVLSPICPGGVAATTWPAILSDLARHVYGVETVLAHESEGRVTLDVAPNAAVAVTASDARVVVLVSGDAGTYPVALLDPKFFLRVPPESRWMVARRSFEAATEAADTSVVQDHVVAIVRAALRAAMDRAAPTALSLDVVLGAGIPVEGLLVDLHNRCYGVLTKQAVIPVEYSAYPDGVPVVRGVRPAGEYPRAALMAAVTALNAAGAGIEPTATVEDGEKRTIGFAAKGSPVLYFLHDPSNERQADLPAVSFPYDRQLVDAAILATVTTPMTTDDRATRLAHAAQYRNRLYQLFVAEFSEALRGDRNAPLRAALTAAIKATRFDNPASVSTLRQKLFELLHDYPRDLAAVRESVAQAYTSGDPKKASIAAIEESVFEFDRRTLAKLRALDTHEDVVAAVRKILAPRIEAVAKLDDTHSLPNMYSACHSGGEHRHCVGRKLAVPDDRLDGFYDILAADVRNPYKAATLATNAAGVFDPLRFIRRPGEHLTIQYS
jgi:hypothetical protein